MAEEHLWTLDDFKDFETIDNTFFNKDNPSASYTSDDEGYTPLCFAALNGVDAKFIAYFMWKANDNQLYDKVYNACKRGKTPLQYACMSNNVNTVSVLTGTSWPYDRLDESGNSVYKHDAYGDTKLDVDGKPILLHDVIPWLSYNGDIMYNVSGYNTTKSTNGDMVQNGEYTPEEIMPSDILEASSLLKADVLKTLVKRYTELNGNQTWHSSEFLDSSKNTPVHLAVIARCYESIRYLLDNDTDPTTTVTFENSELKDPLDLAAAEGDIGIQEILLKYINNASATSNYESLDAVLKYNFGLMTSITNNNEVLNTIYSSKYTFLCIKNKYPLKDNSKHSLIDYYTNIQDEDLKTSIINDFCKSYTEEICADPEASSRYFTGKNYDAFLSSLTAGYTEKGPSGEIKVTYPQFYPQAITALYNLLETERNSQNDSDWVIAALTAQGHESSWTSKAAMIDWIEDTLYKYISTSVSYTSDIRYFIGAEDVDYTNSVHDVIPVQLWSLDTLINYRLNKSLKRYKIAFDSGEISTTIKDYQLYNIKTYLMNNTPSQTNQNAVLLYDYVKGYLPSVSECISKLDYTFMQWLHDNDHLTHDDFVLITDAVTNQILNQNLFVNWPWQDPSL